MNGSSLAHNQLDIKQVQAEAALCWISVLSKEFYWYMIHSAWYLNRSNLIPILDAIRINGHKAGKAWPLTLLESWIRLCTCILDLSFPTTFSPAPARSTCSTWRMHVHRKIVSWSDRTANAQDLAKLKSWYIEQQSRCSHMKTKKDIIINPSSPQFCNPSLRTSLMKSNLNAPRDFKIFGTRSWVFRH